MIQSPTPQGDPMASAEELERLTFLLDEVLTLMAHLIGPVGMQARAAGRVLVVAQRVHGPAPGFRGRP